MPSNTPQKQLSDREQLEFVLNGLKITEEQFRSMEDNEFKRRCEDKLRELLRENKSNQRLCEELEENFLEVMKRLGHKDQREAFAAVEGVALTAPGSSLKEIHKLVGSTPAERALNLDGIRDEYMKFMEEKGSKPRASHTKMSSKDGGKAEVLVLEFDTAEQMSEFLNKVLGRGLLLKSEGEMTATKREGKKEEQSLFNIGAPPERPAIGAPPAVSGVAPRRSREIEAPAREGSVMNDNSSRPSIRGPGR